MVYSEDVEIVRELIEKESVDLYDLHLKYRLSPAQISRSVKNLLKERAVTIKDEIITITDIGRDWIIKNRQALFLDDRGKYWKEEDDNSRFKEEDYYPFEYTIDILKLIEEDEG